MDNTLILQERPFFVDNNVPIKVRDIKMGGVYYVSYEDEIGRETGKMEYEEWLVQVLDKISSMGVNYIIVQVLRERKGKPNRMFDNDGYTVPRDWSIPRKQTIYQIDTRNISKRNIIPGTVPYRYIRTDWTGSRDYPFYAFFTPKLNTAQITYLLGRKGMPANVAGIVSQFLGGPNAPRPPQRTPAMYHFPTESKVIAIERDRQLQNPQPVSIYNIPGTAVERGEELYGRVTNIQNQWRNYMRQTHNVIAKEKEQRRTAAMEKAGPVYGPLTERNTAKAKQIAEDTRVNTMHRDLKEIMAHRAGASNNIQPSTAPMNQPSEGGSRRRKTRRNRRVKVTARLNRRTLHKQ